MRETNDLKIVSLARASLVLATLCEDLEDARLGVRAGEAQNLVAWARFADTLQKRATEIASYSPELQAGRFDWLLVFDNPERAFPPGATTHALSRETRMGYARYVGGRVAVDRVRVLVAANGAMQGAQLLWGVRLAQWINLVRDRIDGVLRQRLEWDEPELWVAEQPALTVFVERRELSDGRPVLWKPVGAGCMA